MIGVTSMFGLRRRGAGVSRTSRWCRGSHRRGVVRDVVRGVMCGRGVRRVGGVVRGRGVPRVRGAALGRGVRRDGGAVRFGCIPRVARVGGPVRRGDVRFAGGRVLGADCVLRPAVRDGAAGRPLEDLPPAAFGCPRRLPALRAGGARFGPAFLSMTGWSALLGPASGRPAGAATAVVVTRIDTANSDARTTNRRVRILSTGHLHRTGCRGSGTVVSVETRPGAGLFPKLHRDSDKGLRRWANRANGDG